MNRLELRDLVVRYGPAHRGLTAVDGVSLTLAEGTTIGVVGESGSGKSTIAKAIVGLAPVTAGAILLDGEDLGAARAAQRRGVRRRVQMVFQDPSSCLDPRMTAGASIGEALVTHRRMRHRSRQEEVARLLGLVGLDPAIAGVLPRALSGGQRQRVALARALAVEPDVLIADEITSALDVSVQGAVLNLIRDLQRRLGLTMLFISHDLAVVRYVSDVVAVMHAGRIVELGPAQQLMTEPRDAYTRALLAASPALTAAASDC
ncbi:ABC transporter ATP-binding protein [Conexibacter woesei]|uniref:ABC transporter related protein n=1 Tax=Conexibacter woesei (strain DSM 14684 / CCUG 47730 / CIP 108061 / JCM 11494 / NBRC 100937 / ID131577) TaxID=469383 RepID=D3F4A8_CONWI|nr:dipeptide/oligopeptide/nickel ABC transporter ATP-binding protein [Conexibacter woesei]ADB50480.1 ABC transporter related protein [Conexibacter woesei DSM 14684]